MAVIWSLNPKFISQISHHIDPSVLTPAHIAPPKLPNQFSIDQGKLLISLARTHALANTSHLALRALTSIAAAFPELVDDGHADLFVLVDVEDFADAIKSAVAGMAGAGLADVVMDHLGYGWRANARQAGLQPPPGGSQQIPDFVYDSGSQILPFNSLVIMEAKGSLSQTTGTAAQTAARALSAFTHQVAPYLDPPGQRTTAGFVLEYGYAIAFSSIPGQQSTTIALVEPDQSPGQAIASAGGTTSAPPQRRHTSAAAGASQPPSGFTALRSASAAVGIMSAGGGGYLLQPMHMGDQVQQQLLEAVAGGGGIRFGDGRPPERFIGAPRINGRVAFLNYATDLRAIGAYETANVLQSLAVGAALTNPAAEAFTRVEVEGERFLISSNVLGGYWDSLAQRRSLALFGIYEPSARAVLDRAIGLDAVPPYVEVPEVPERMLERVLASGLSIARDGLALLSFDWPILESGSVQWDPNNGWSD